MLPLTVTETVRRAGLLLEDELDEDELDEADDEAEPDEDAELPDALDELVPEPDGASLPQAARPATRASPAAYRTIGGHVVFVTM